MEETQRAAQGSTGSGTTASWRNARWLFPLIAAAIVMAAYARAPFLDFVYDDDIIVKANPYITSAKNIPAYFTEHIWSNLNHARKNYYRPVFLLWLLGNYLEFGTDPPGWHLSSLLLHLGSVVLVYLLALRITSQRFAALAAALLFGLHPVQVENVAWASASTELLGSFLALAALHCYFLSLDSAPRRVLLLASSVFLYALAVMAKETAIIVPAIIFLHEWLDRPASPVRPAPRSPGAALRAALHESIPFGIVAVAYLAARVAVLEGMGHTVAHISTRVCLQTIPSILRVYLLHTIWPARLSAFYDYPYISEFTLQSVLLPLGLVVGLVALLAVAVRKSPAGQLAAIWMVLPIVPVLDVRVFPRGEFIHDRYLYHPMIGASLLAAIGIAAIQRRWPWRWTRMALYAGGTVVAVALGVATFRQTGYWTDNFTLYSRGVAVAPRSAFANNNLGSVLLNRGEWDAAMGQFQKAIDDSPNLYLAHYDMGMAYYQVGRFAEAEACFQRAVKILPEDADSNMFLGMTYYRTNRLPEAIESVRKAIALNPNATGYHFALAVMLKDQKDRAGARAEFLEELKRDPNHQPTLDQLRLLDQTAPAPVKKQ